MLYGDPNELERCPRTGTFERVQPATSRAQPTIPGVVLVLALVVDEHLLYGHVMKLDRMLIWP